MIYFYLLKLTINDIVLNINSNLNQNSYKKTKFHGLLKKYYIIIRRKFLKIKIIKLIF